MTANPAEPWTRTDAARDLSEQTAEWDAMWAGEIRDAAEDAIDERPTRAEADRDENGPNYYERRSS